MAGKVPSQRYWDEVEALEAQRRELAARKERLLREAERLVSRLQAIRGEVAHLDAQMEALSKQITWREVHWDEVEGYWQTAQAVPTVRDRLRPRGER